jgi:hypothetical protein
MNDDTQIHTYIHVQPHGKDFLRKPNQNARAYSCFYKLYMHTHTHTYMHAYIHVQPHGKDFLRKPNQNSRAYSCFYKLYVYTHTYIHACMHAHIHVQPHGKDLLRKPNQNARAYSCSYKPWHTHTHTYMYSQMVISCESLTRMLVHFQFFSRTPYVHPFKYTRILTYTHAHGQIKKLFSCNHAHVRMYMHTYIHTYIYIHTCIHTYVSPGQKLVQRRSLTCTIYTNACI